MKEEASDTSAYIEKLSAMKGQSTGVLTPLKIILNLLIQLQKLINYLQNSRNKM